ncbi:DUF1772 domain-containing protein [Pontibacter toksunensis]|uniref:DUF1772 domain-containing protein n=1 Tax=Pontibacter toksunensis TaxID=1332631 RepID=A0ABW6BZT0_9BACT
MNLFLEFLATLSAGLFTGASIYINLVEHPARMSLGTALAATEFVPSYRRATVMQVLLAVVSFFSALAAWFMEAGINWLIGATLIIIVIPFTVIAILPTNKQLLDPALDKGSEHAQQLLNRWGKLHAVRSILSLSSLVTYLYALVWE